MLPPQPCMAMTDAMITMMTNATIPAAEYKYIHFSTARLVLSVRKTELT